MPRRPPELLLGPYQPLPVSLAQHSCSRPSAPHFICTHRPGPGKRRPGAGPHSPGRSGRSARPAPRILREIITSQGYPAPRPRCGPRRPARPPASLKLQPSEEKKEQNHKFRLIKHLLILQQFSRPLRNPPETRGAPVIFCYIIFLVKYFPRQSPQRGSNITVTNQNQCALTY